MYPPSSCRFEYIVLRDWIRGSKYFQINIQNTVGKHVITDADYAKFQTSCTIVCQACIVNRHLQWFHLAVIFCNVTVEKYFNALLIFQFVHFTYFSWYKSRMLWIEINLLPSWKHVNKKTPINIALVLQPKTMFLGLCVKNGELFFPVSTLTWVQNGLLTLTEGMKSSFAWRSKVLRVVCDWLCAVLSGLWEGALTFVRHLWPCMYILSNQAR